MTIGTSRNSFSAYQLSKSPISLRFQLMLAYMQLTEAMQVAFGNYIFDYYNGQFIAEDGSYSLQWRSRAFPQKPASPINPQEKTGIVFLVKKGKI